MKSSATRSPKARNVEPDPDEFAGRLASSVEGRVLAEVARAVGVAPSTIQRYLSGSVPAADTALKLARELEVDLAWLIEGQPFPPAPTKANDGGEVVHLSQFDVFQFGEYGRGEATAVAVPRWLLGSFNPNSVWLTQMPSDAIPSLASEGDVIVCRDPETPIQDRRVYIFLLDGRPIIRRVFVRPEGLELRTDDPADTMTIRPDEQDGLMPAGRVLAALNLKPA